MPRLYRGHDVSGHIFLLTLCVLFLHEQLVPAWRVVGSGSMVHGCAVAAASVLLGLWVFMCLTTSLYWHKPFEKITGFGVYGFCRARAGWLTADYHDAGLGLVGFALTKVPFLIQKEARTAEAR